MKSRHVFFTLVFSICALLFAPGSRAQTAQGRITGQVTDASGGAIVGAKVSITNTASGVARELETGGSGDYVAPGIEPGVYSITVENAGFEKLVREGVHVEVGNDLRVDFRMKPGAVTQSIEVNEDLPLTETNNAVLNGVLSNKAINDLPLQGRDFQNLLPLHPGVQRDPGGGFHTLTSNGNRPDDNNFIIDGANDNDAYYGETVMNDAGISGTPASTLPLDAIQEFNTSEGQQADYGAKPGVVVNIGIKSGTNQVHGTAYYFHRNSALDARNFFNPAPEPTSALLLHQFGASVGGPIMKDKWFYFVNYEGVRDKVGNPLVVDSPVTTSLVGRVDPTEFDPTQYSIVDAEAAAGCGITPLPSTCNQLSLNLVNKVFPKNPGLTADPDDPSAINFDFNNVNREDNLVFKTDYHPNDRNSISGRFLYANSHEIEEDASPVAPQWLSEAFPKSQVFGVDWAWTPNSRWVNDLRFSYNRFYEKIAPVDASVNPTAYGLTTGITDPNLFGFPRINPGSHDFNYLGGNSSWPLWTTPSHTENYGDTVSYSRGKHSIRFGGVFSNGGVDYLRATEGRGRVDFFHLQDFIAGTPVDEWALQYGNPARKVSMKYWALFAQYDVRLTPRLTINAGLRYDVTYPIKDAHNLLANFSPTDGLQQVGSGISSPYKTNYNNVSPRLGVAWDIFGTGKTVLRSGFGMIYVQPSIRTFMFGGGGLNLNPTGLPKFLPDGTEVPANGNITTFLVFGADPGLINWSVAGPIFPGANSGTNSCSVTLPCNIFAVDRNIHTPYVLNWNVNVQQALGRDMMLQVAYVGNRGVHLYSITDPNQADPAISTNDPDFCLGCDNTQVEQLARPYTTNCPGSPCFPYIGFINQLGNKSTSIYHGLQATLTKRYSKGLYLLAGYTYAHAIDTNGETTNLADVPQNSLNFPAEKGDSDYDIRHRFTLAATYEIPSRKSWGQLLEGWEVTSLVTAQSGYPYSFFDDGSDLTGTGEGFNNAGNDRWNILGSPKNIKWVKNGSIPFLDESDPICQSAANTPALQASLDFEEGCFAQNGTVIYPNAVGTFGNMGRNIFRGPNFVDWDGSVGKSWKLTERLKLQIRAELFNVLNHPIFADGSVRKDLFSFTLGVARATPDVEASNPVIGSGGSRHIQLGAKFIF